MPPSPREFVFAVRTLTLGATLLWATLARGNVTPAALFQDGLVLQTGKPVTVWGQAAPAEKVSVSFAGQNVSAEAGSDGAWKAVLTPLKVSAEPAELVCQGNNTVTIKNVLVGEVWLCSGQSNMEFELSKAKDAAQEIAAANHPLIRQFLVPKGTSNSPEQKFRGKWLVCTPVDAGGFTAVGYFFARELSGRLNVPVGIVDSTWGGTYIEAWMTAESIARDPALGFVASEWQKKLENYPATKAKFDADEADEARKFEDAKTRGETYKKKWHRSPPNPDGSPNMDKPSNLYNAMIHPVTPATLAGILWYQGENNTDHPDLYGALFRAMIPGWREAFHRADLPFYWVQLPNYNGNPSTLDWVRLRAAQAQALSLPATGQAVTIDVGETANIHPLDKQDVGHRLALIALRQVYGQTLVASGPTFAGAKFEGGSAQVAFTDLGGGLELKNFAPSAFELAGADHVFKPAEARVEGDTVVVRADAVPSPAALRYAWRNAPAASLFNKEGLPAAPFRSDAW